MHRSTLSIHTVLAIRDHHSLSRWVLDRRLSRLSSDAKCSLRRDLAISSWRQSRNLLLAIMLLDESASLLIHVHRVEGKHPAIWKVDMLESLTFEGWVRREQLRCARLPRQQTPLFKRLLTIPAR
jgi:hypothetical protein